MIASFIRATRVVYRTVALLERELKMPVTRLQSGPLGGDLQIGAKIAEGAVDFINFFRGPCGPRPPDPDVKALLRIAVVWNIPVACNRAPADFTISSPLMGEPYDHLFPAYDAYRRRALPPPDA